MPPIPPSPTTPPPESPHPSQRALALLPVPHPSLPRDRNPALVYLASLPSPRSRETMRFALSRISSLVHPGLDFTRFPWHLLRFQHTAALRALLIQRFRPSTANVYLSALKQVLRNAWRLQLISTEDYRQASSISLVRHHSMPHGRRVPQGELRALFEAAMRRHPHIAARDAAILGLLYGGGLRRAEVVGLDLEHVQLAERLVSVRSGKGRKDRRVPLPGGSIAAIEAWLAVRGTAPGPLFWRIRQGGRLVPGRLTAHSIARILRTLAKGAAIPPLTPHDLRRTFISDLLDADADVLSVSRLAGHSSPATTRRYDLRGDEADRNAVERLHVPFGPH